MSLMQMYDAMPNSPITFLASNITATDTQITVTNGSSLPNAPNMPTIGFTEDAETILYAEKSGNVLKGVTRGFQKQAKAWVANTPVARLVTEYDFKAFKENILDTNAQLADITNGVTTVGDAGKLGGKSANFYFRQIDDNPIGFGGDLNDLITPGYQIDVRSVVLNRPPGESWGAVYVTHTGSNPGYYVQQLWIGLSGKMFIRVSQNKVWGSWDEVRHSGSTGINAATVGKTDGTYLNATQGYKAVVLHNAEFFIATPSRSVSNGNAYYPWKNIYSETAVIVMSDKNQKENIQKIDDKYIDFLMSLNPVLYEFKDNSINEYMRMHCGLITQEVEESLYENGLNSLDFAGLIISPIHEEIETGDFKEESFIDENGEQKTRKIPIMKKIIIGEQYGLRYEEFIALLIKTVQVQQGKIDDLEERIIKSEEIQKQV